MSLGNTGKSTGILAGAVSEAVPGWSVLGVDGVFDTKHSLATPAVIAASRPPNEAKGLWRLPLSEAAALTSMAHVTPEMGKVMKAVLGGEGCLMCTPGKATSGWSQGSCTNCEPGLYQPGHGHRFCNACPAGKYSAEKTIGGVSRGSTVGATACWDCPAGRMQVMRGMSICSRCSPGFFSSGVGQEVCSPCPAGRFTSGFGATECDRCPAGKSNLVVGQSVCVDCSPGTYAAGSGMKLCTPCSPGTFTDATGVSACSQCGPGRYTSSAGRTECQSCPAGKHSSLMATHSIGASICQDCARGRYSPEAGALQCTKATPGRYVSGRGQSTTQACPVGRFSREHAAAPSEGALVPPSAVPMPGGVGVPVMDSSVTCEPCHAGKYCDAPGMTLSDAKLCKAGRWGRPGATSPACHGACPAGRMCPDGTAEGASLPCTAGTFCPAGTGAAGTRVTPGFYSYDSAAGSASTTGGTDQARCPPGHFCVDGKLEKCPAGRYESKFGKTACKNLCSPGFFCPEGSTQDRVQACAADKDSPQEWYCPEGVTSPMRTSDYTAASSPGQYTPAYEPPTQRTQATSCSGTTACWKGVQYPRLAFADDVCKNGFGSITATVPSLVGESTITIEPHTLKVHERMSGPLPTSMSAGLASFSVGDFRPAPGCKGSNPFTLSSDGVLTMSGAMSPLECPFLGVRITALATSVKATCDVVVRLQTDEGAIREPAASIAAGSGHVCYILPPASSGSWGGNLICLASGGDSTREKTLAAPSSLYGWMQVAAGAAHVCGLDAAGIVKCFGRQQVSSRGTEHVWSTPTGWGRARSVSAGEDFTCVIAVGVKKEDTVEGAGRLHCIGSNEELGSAWAAAQPSFMDKQIAVISVGGNAVCAIASSDGSLACFGTSGASRLLANVPAGAFTQVSVGLTSNACGLRRSDSKLLCWGAQWSVGTMEYPAAFTAVAVGEDWICGVLQSSSRLQCYGNIIPRVFSSYSNIPTEPVVQVAAGKDMLCITQTSGLVQCFGRSQVSASAVSRLGKGVLALLPM